MLIVNADDLGMSPGANKAIFDGVDQGVITHASIMANADYVKEAIDGAKKRKALGLGVHLNITYGKALIESPFYCDNDGIFNLSYKTLLLRIDPLFLEAIEKEWEAQIAYVVKSIPKRLTHLDSHRHIHLIPHLYPIVIRLAKKYHIPRVRLIQENMFASLFLSKSLDFIVNGGIIKYILLRFFSMINVMHENRYHGIHFYSILYTGVVEKKVLHKLQNKHRKYEVMVHPSYPDLDTTVHFYDEAEKAYRISPDRYKELQSVFSLKKDFHD